MEISGIYIQRISSKLKLVLFSYFPVTSCEKGGAGCFQKYIYKEIVEN